MPINTTAPPTSVAQEVSQFIAGMAAEADPLPSGLVLDPSHLTITAPHQVYILGLDAILHGAGLGGAVLAGWRFLVADNNQIVASAELDLPDQPAIPPSTTHTGGGPPVFIPSPPVPPAPWLTVGPFVNSTAVTIEALESHAELTVDMFEFRLLRVPALYIFAGWLVGNKTLVFPMSPTPSFLVPRLYTETEFVNALMAPAAIVNAYPEPSGG